MSVLEQMIGWLAPSECIVCSGEGSVLCVHCSTTEIVAFGERCWRCSALSPAVRACPKCRHARGPRAVWISTNYEDTAKRLIQTYKFGQVRVAAEPLARMMVQNFNGFHQKFAIKPAGYLVVPVPTATSRQRQRGFDHSALLTKTIAHRLKLPYSPLLGRLGQQRQLGSLRSQRLAQTAGSYYAKRSVAGQDILLVDDVITTGGTIIECAKLLRAAGARHVDALIFAKKL